MGENRGKNRSKNWGKNRFGPISNHQNLFLPLFLPLFFEEIEIPSVYFSHERDVFSRDGMLLADSEFVERSEDEELSRRKVRYRTVGDMSCTGAVESEAENLRQIIEEVSATRITERGATRADDRVSEAAMEDRKKEGYF